MEKVRLSKTQQQVVDFMRKQKCMIHLATGMNARVYFMGGDAQAWDLATDRKTVSISTLFALRRKGILVDNTDPDGPYYRRDYELCDAFVGLKDQISTGYIDADASEPCPASDSKIL